MILRVYRAVVCEGQQAAFQAFLEETAIPVLRACKGMSALRVGWPHEASPREFSMIMEWETLEDLIAFTGENWREAVVHPDEAHLLEASYVSHFHLRAPD